MHMEGKPKSNSKSCFWFVQEQACLVTFRAERMTDGHGVQVDRTHSSLFGWTNAGLSCKTTVYIGGLYDERKCMIEMIKGM